MRKFTKVYMIILVIFICFGVIGIIFTDEPNDTAEIDQATIDKTPGYETMTAVANIASEQLRENALLDIEVSPQAMNQEVVVHLQSNEFMTEDTLLQDSYRLLEEFQKLEDVATFKIIWYMLISDANTEVLSLAFSHDSLEDLATLSYKEIKSLATSYETHDVLQ